jgi:hydrogenase maturation protein HypF
MELEALADGEPDAPYPAALDTIDDRIVVRTTDLVRAVVEDILGDVPAALIAGRFHATLADIIARVARHMRERRGIARTALSGGVFQNVRLLERTIAVLESDGFGVLRHRHVPPNDGGLALGQAAIAARWLARRTG